MWQRRTRKTQGLFKRKHEISLLLKRTVFENAAQPKKMRKLREKMVVDGKRSLGKKTPTEGV